jgi:alkylhydroperoxidase family enzyme
VPEATISSLLANIQTAPVSEKLKPVIAYIRKLTLTPTQMTQQDAEAIYAAGWDERALYDAVQVCCLYNFMNRFVEGLGLVPRPDQFDMEGKMIKEGGYAGMVTAFGIK